jgi:hypothetical protein
MTGGPDLGVSIVHPSHMRGSSLVDGGDMVRVSSRAPLHHPTQDRGRAELGIGTTARPVGQFTLSTETTDAITVRW